MMQKTPPVVDLTPQETATRQALTAQEHDTDRVATIWVSRITSVVGLLLLVIALAVWAFRPGHFRFVLALLTIAMFAAILHSYTFENGS